jgi:hypothetical protein
MMKFGKPSLLVAAVATVFGVSLFGNAANAAVPGQTQTPGTGTNSSPHPVHLAGRVTSVSGSGLVLKTPRGSITVDASSNTWIVVQRNGQCAEGTLQDIQTGKLTQVMGMTTAVTNMVEARVISQARCAQAPNGATPAKRLAAAALAKHVAAGTVKAANGSVLTVTLDKGNKGNRDITVNTSAATVVLDNGFQGISSVKVGDKIQVFGRPDKPAGKPAAGVQPSIIAWGLRVVSPGEQLIAGRVSTVNGNTVTLQTAKNKTGVTVTLDSSTAYKSLTVTGNQPVLSSGSQTTIMAGSTLIVEGTGPADGTALAAKAVIILPGPKAKTTTP